MVDRKQMLLTALGMATWAPLAAAGCDLFKSSQGGDRGLEPLPDPSSAPAVSTNIAPLTAQNMEAGIPRALPVRPTDAGPRIVAADGSTTWALPSGFPTVLPPMPTLFPSTVPPIPPMPSVFTLPPMPSGFPKTLPSTWPSAWPTALPSATPPKH